MDTTPLKWLRVPTNKGKAAIVCILNDVFAIQSNFCPYRAKTTYKRKSESMRLEITDVKHPPPTPYCHLPVLRSLTYPPPRLQWCHYFFTMAKGGDPNYSNGCASSRANRECRQTSQAAFLHIRGRALSLYPSLSASLLSDTFTLTHCSEGDKKRGERKKKSGKTGGKTE